jgi:hypothetical protein
MILHLMRRHLASQSITVPLSIIMAIMVVLWPISGVAMILPLQMMMIQRTSQQRASLFEAALPIRGRELFLARLLSTLAITWLPLLTWVVATLIRRDSYWPVSYILDLSAIATLAIILPYSIRAGEISAPPVRLVILSWIALAAASALAIYVLTPVMALTLFAFAIVAVFVMAWTAIPESFQTAPREAGAAAALISPTTESPTGRSNADGWWWPILRSVVAPIALLYFLLMAVFGALGAMWLLYFFFSSIVYSITRQRTRWMCSLPLSHRGLLLIGLVPMIVSVPGGLALGTNIHLPYQLGGGMTINHDAPTPRATTRYFNNRTNVALEYWRRSPDGRPPAIVAPWGESYPPDVLTVLGVSFYNPYSSGEGSSQRFIEWQFERATTAVYGRPISLEEYDADGAVRPPRVTRSPRMQILNGGAILALVLCLAFLGELARWHRLSGTRPGRTIAMVVTIAPMFLVIADMIYGIKHGTQLITPATEAILLHASRILPSGVLPVIVTAAVPVIAMYALLEWQFGKSEMTERVIQPSV